MDRRRLRGQGRSRHLDFIRLRSGRLCNLVFQLLHRVANVVGSALYVVRCRCARIGVTQDSLDDYVRHPKPIQVAPKSSPSGVPAVPDRNALVSLVLVLRVAVVVLSLMAALATVESRDYDPVYNAVSARGFPTALAKIGPLCGLPQRSRCSSSRSASWRITGIHDVDITFPSRAAQLWFLIGPVICV